MLLKSLQEKRDLLIGLFLFPFDVNYFWWVKYHKRETLLTTDLGKSTSELELTFLENLLAMSSSACPIQTQHDHGKETSYKPVRKPPSDKDRQPRYSESPLPESASRDCWVQAWVTAIQCDRGRRLHLSTYTTYAFSMVREAFGEHHTDAIRREGGEKFSIFQKNQVLIFQGFHHFKNVFPFLHPKFSINLWKLNGISKN